MNKSYNLNKNLNNLNKNLKYYNRHFVTAFGQLDEPDTHLNDLDRVPTLNSATMTLSLYDEEINATVASPRGEIETEEKAELTCETEAQLATAVADDDKESEVNMDEIDRVDEPVPLPEFRDEANHESTTWSEGSVMDSLDIQHDTRTFNRDNRWHHYEQGCHGQILHGFSRRYVASGGLRKKGKENGVGRSAGLSRSDYGRRRNPLSAQFRGDNICGVSRSLAGRAIKGWSHGMERLFVRPNAASVTNEGWRNTKLEPSRTHLTTMGNPRGDYPDDTKTSESGSSAASSNKGQVSPPEERHAHRPDGPGTRAANQGEHY